MSDEVFTRPHRRRNALTGEWLLVSPQRTQRPWQGESTTHPQDATLPYDPDCYLCPGNARAGGERNPPYERTYVFENDYAALRPEIRGESTVGDQVAVESVADGSSADTGCDELLVARPESGRCRVVCFSPRHDLSIARMPLADVRAVIDAWAFEYERLGSQPNVASVVIFENHGAAMGASNPHPHAQIWATETIPNEPAKELARFAAFGDANDGACLLCAYVAREYELGERIVYANDDAIVLVPFWAVWPFETMIVSRRHRGSLVHLDDGERDAFADAMGVLTRAYDRVFDAPFPYSMGFHQETTDGTFGGPLDESESTNDPSSRAIENAESHPARMHLHAHYLPPLLRSASVRKYMVGFELLGMPQRDITPESAAARLRELVRSS